MQSPDVGPAETGAVAEGEAEARSLDSTALEAIKNDGADADSEPTAKKEKTQAEGAVNGEHTCPDCGMSFDRRYSLIMHTLKHEKSRGYKCNVSRDRHRLLQY